MQPRRKVLLPCDQGIEFLMGIMDHGAQQNVAIRRLRRRIFGVGMLRALGLGHDDSRRWFGGCRLFGGRFLIDPFGYRLVEPLSDFEDEIDDSCDPVVASWVQLDVACGSIAPIRRY